MSVMKRGNSRCWYIQFQHDGRTYIRSAKTTDRKIAEALEAEWKKQVVANGALNIKERISLGAALQKHLAAKKALPSYRYMAYHARMIEAYFGTGARLSDIRSLDIDRWCNRLRDTGYSNQSIVHSIGILRGTMKTAKRLGFEVGEAEFPSIKLPKGKLRYLTIDEEKRLLEELDPKRDVIGLVPYGQRPALTQREMHDVYDLVVLLLDTGARYSEIARLEWKQVDLKERRIALWRSKVQNESLIYMTSRVATILERRASERISDWVFTNKKGNAPRRYTIGALRKAFARANVSDITVHTLRHTHATRLIQHGMSIYEVKEVLGHADIRTTMRYAHIEQRVVSAKAMQVIERLQATA